MNRRKFLIAGTAAMAAATIPSWAANLNQFNLGVITDEVTDDLEQSLLWAKAFGLHWVELRYVWEKYVTEFTPDDVSRAKDQLAKHAMRVSVLDSPFFKVPLPGTTSRFTDPKDPLQASGNYEKQPALLERAIARAKDFGTDKVRIFSFMRVDKPQTVFDRVARELSKAAETAKREGIRLVLENENSCNVATGAESAAMLQAVKSPALGLNWDPGNAYAAGETRPYPDGYARLDKKRIWHMHLKDAQPDPKGGESTWRPIGGGKIDYLGQFRALLRDGYAGTMSLETHYSNSQHDRKTSSDESMRGLLEVIHRA